MVKIQTWSTMTWCNRTIQDDNSSAKGLEISKDRARDKQINKQTNDKWFIDFNGIDHQHYEVCIISILLDFRRILTDPEMPFWKTMSTICDFMTDFILNENNKKTLEKLRYIWKQHIIVKACLNP